MRRVSDELSNDRTDRVSIRGRCVFALVMFLIAIVPVTEIAEAVGPGAPPCPGATYSVVSGDSWSRIASRAKVKMSELLAANAATTTTVIHPGQTVCLPGGAVNAAPTTV